jgi:hypothetical protein
MQTHAATTRIAFVGGLLMVLSPAEAKADAPAFPVSEGAVLGVVAAAALLPSEAGVAIPTANASSPNFVLGWSWQIPVSAWFGDHRMSHRVVGGVDLLPHSGGADWRGRIGYRYATHWVFGGVGIGLDDARGNLSPEVGVKFAHSEDRDSDIVDLGAHLLARAEIAPDTGHVKGATILLGWNVF